MQTTINSKTKNLYINISIDNSEEYHSRITTNNNNKSDNEMQNKFKIHKIYIDYKVRQQFKYHQININQ